MLPHSLPKPYREALRRFADERTAWRRRTTAAAAAATTTTPTGSGSTAGGPNPPPTGLAAPLSPHAPTLTPTKDTVAAAKSVKSAAIFVAADTNGNGFMDRRELSWLFMATGGGGAGFDGFDEVLFAEVCRELGADVLVGITPYDLLSTYNTLAGENVDSDYHILVTRGVITPPPPMPQSSPMSERVCAALSEAEARDKCEEAATATHAPNLADVDRMEAVEEELFVFTRHFCAHEIEKQFYGSSSDTSQWIGLDALMAGSGGDRSFARLGGFIEAAR